MPNMVTVRRHVPVEGSNQKLVVLTHPNHFTIGGISTKSTHRHRVNMYGLPIHSMVHATTVTAVLHMRHPPRTSRRRKPGRRGCLREGASGNSSGARRVVLGGVTTYVDVRIAFLARTLRARMLSRISARHFSL